MLIGQRQQGREGHCRGRQTRAKGVNGAMGRHQTGLGDIWPGGWGGAQGVEVQPREGKMRLGGGSANLTAEHMDSRTSVRMGLRGAPKSGQRGIRQQDSGNTDRRRAKWEAGRCGYCSSFHLECNSTWNPHTHRTCSKARTETFLRIASGRQHGGYKITTYPETPMVLFYIGGYYSMHI